MTNVERKAAKKIVEDSKRIYSRQEFATVDAVNFSHLDLKFYDKTSSFLQNQGFKFLADVEILNLKGGFLDLRTFLRILVSDDGSISAAIYHPKPKLLASIFLRIIGAEFTKTVDFDTEFSDGSFVTTSNSHDAKYITLPTEVRADFLEPKTSVQIMLQHHSDRVNKYLIDNSEIQHIKVRNIEEYFEFQNRLQELKANYRKSVGYVTEEEMIELGAKRETAAKIVREIDRIEQ